MVGWGGVGGGGSSLRTETYFRSSLLSTRKRKYVCVRRLGRKHSLTEAIQGMCATKEFGVKSFWSEWILCQKWSKDLYFLEPGSGKPPVAGGGGKGIVDSLFAILVNCAGGYIHSPLPEIVFSQFTCNCTHNL